MTAEQPDSCYSCSLVDTLEMRKKYIVSFPLLNCEKCNRLYCNDCHVFESRKGFILCLTCYREEDLEWCINFSAPGEIVDAPPSSYDENETNTINLK